MQPSICSRWPLVTLVAIVALMVVGTGACQDADDLQTLGSELDTIAAENRLIEDLNRLQLSPVQVKALVAAVGELQEATLPIRQERVGVLKELKPLLLEQREKLIRDEHPPATLRQKITDAEDKLRDLDERIASAMRTLAPKFREILTGPQLSIVTGAEEARLRVAELLEWVRELDDAAFPRESGPYAEELADPELGLTADKITAVFEAARKMTGPEYKEKGPGLWQQLMPLFMPTEAAADHITVDFFAHPAMGKVLAEKLDVGNGQ